ncbi:hypothetical protein Tcan_09244 [Toxocara canis]|uniref:Uncharacterized protein n=1 Tax=Toxocara canis TaxID=6265 RepID=A0A0B2VRM3_TOXCA|nr:hypothetical protein Tcan_09244 [Toxocara canis]
MGGNIEAPLATAEAQPVHNHEEPLLSQFHYNSIAYAIVIGAVTAADENYVEERVYRKISDENHVEEQAAHRIPDENHVEMRTKSSRDRG